MLLQGRESAAPEGGRKKDRVFHLNFILDNQSTVRKSELFSKTEQLRKQGLLKKKIKQAVEERVPLSRSTDF